MNKGDIYALSDDAWQQLCDADPNVLHTSVSTEDERTARQEAFITSEAVGHMQGTFAMQRTGSKAILPIIGMIRPRASFSLADLFGASSTSLTLASRDLGAAVNDDSIDEIILAFDSPGGLVAGTNEFADQVFEARSAGKKITAFIEHACASAAYWIASAADEIVISPTGLAGSIGVQMSFMDTSAAAEKEGFKQVTITSALSPNKNRPFNTPEGQADAQAIVDQQATIFVEAVARNRGVDVDTVKTEFGQGSLFVGEKAKAAGLADRVSSFHELLGISKPETTGVIQMDRKDQLAALVDSAAAGTVFVANSYGELRQIDLNDEATLKDLAKDAVASIAANAKAEGEAAGAENFRASEAKRITEIDAAFEGNELFKPVADELKADSSTTVASIFAECNERMKKGELSPVAAMDDEDSFAGLGVGSEEIGEPNLDRQQAAGAAADDERLSNVTQLKNKPLAAGIAEAAAEVNASKGHTE